MTTFNPMTHTPEQLRKAREIAGKVFRAMAHKKAGERYSLYTHYAKVCEQGDGDDYDVVQAALAAIVATEAETTEKAAKLTEPLRRAFSLLIAICDNEPDVPVADNGMTVLDAVRSDARKLISEHLREPGHG